MPDFVDAFSESGNPAPLDDPGSFSNALLFAVEKSFEIPYGNEKNGA